MFNFIDLNSKIFLLAMFSFFVFFTIRKLFISRKRFILLYHICVFFVLFIGSIGGGSVLNDGDKRLEEFTLLERNNQLEQAKKNPQNYDSMLQIDLEQFKSYNEFKDYLMNESLVVDKFEAVFVGWIFALLAEISMMITQTLNYIRNKMKGIKQ